MKFNRAMYYYVFILILGGLILFRFFIRPYARKLEKKLEAKKNQALKDQQKGESKAPEKEEIATNKVEAQGSDSATAEKKVGV